MRKKNYKERCEKRALSKCIGVNKGYVTMWGASDALSFYGSSLSFVKGLKTEKVLTVICLRLSKLLPKHITVCKKSKIPKYLQILWERECGKHSVFYKYKFTTFSPIFQQKEVEFLCMRMILICKSISKIWITLKSPFQIACFYRKSDNY